MGGYLLMDLLKDILGGQMTGLWVHGHCCVMNSTPFDGQVRVLHSFGFHRLDKFLDLFF